MADDQFFKQIEDSGCGVAAGVFPCLGKCCGKSSSLSGEVYNATCPHCKIWTSLPDGANLAITNIFECLLYGYGKRIRQ